MNSYTYNGRPIKSRRPIHLRWIGDDDWRPPASVQLLQCESEKNWTLFTRHSLVRAKGEVFVLLYVCLFVRSTISRQPAGRFTPHFACGRSLGRDVSSPLLGFSDPLGGKKRGNDIGVVSFVHRTATISIFLRDAKCSPICRAQICAHSDAEPSRSAKGFLHGGPKSSKKFRIFHHFETLRPYISETIKYRGI